LWLNGNILTLFC